MFGPSWIWTAHKILLTEIQWFLVLFCFPKSEFDAIYWNFSGWILKWPSCFLWRLTFGVTWVKYDYSINRRFLIVDLLETMGTAKMVGVIYLLVLIVFYSTIVMPEKHIDIIFFRNNNRFCNLLKLQQVWYQFILMRFDISRFEIKIVFQITNCEMKISRYCSVTTRSYYVIGKKIDWGHGKILLVFLFYFYYSSMSYATVRFCFTSFINIITIQRYNLILLLRN